MKRAFEAIKSGASDLELFEEHTTVAFKYQRGVAAARSALIKPRSPSTEPEIQIYFGDSGTGKTRKAVEDNPDAYIVTKPESNGMLWWDGYNGQDTIIIDEFYGWIPLNFMLRLMDRYPLKVQIKGGMVDMAATKFILTSNVTWHDWYHWDKHPASVVEAFKRRINEWGSVWEYRKGQEPKLLPKEDAAKDAQDQQEGDLAFA